jgi:competence protein ComGA
MKNFFTELLEQSIKNKVQDIYVLPYQNEQYEIKTHDGKELKSIQLISFEFAQKLISYVKYTANMNIAENRRPQLGSINWQSNKANIPLRISTVGQYQNIETMVIRIIYDQNITPNEWIDNKQFDEILEKMPSNGLVLMVGPTGSGKTSTVHQIISSRQENELILSIEDPVEIRNPTIVQLQVNEQADMSYNDLIKVSLRHHPDLLVIGEIRDEKTAKATIQAALSGHLVLATIHANSAKESIDRLIDLGVEPNLAKNTVKLAVFQKLIKKENGKLAAIVDIQDKCDLHSKDFKFTRGWNETIINAIESKTISPETKKTLEKIAA